MAHLPRYVALKTGPQDSHGSYLTLAVRNGIPHLTFTSQQITRFSTFEILFNSDVSDVVMIRAANRRFCRLDSFGFLVANMPWIPDPAQNTGCYFRVERQGSGLVVFQSIVQNLYVKRFTGNGVTNGFCAMGRDIDQFTAMHVTAAEFYAVSLPPFIMLFGDNERYMGDHRERNINWLKFDKPDPSLSAAHEVIALLDGNVMVRNVNINRFWRRSPDWIWADANESTALTDINCHFDVIRVSSTLVAFRSLANNLICKRYTQFWVDCLRPNGTTINDPATRLLLSEASLSRRLFNIRYLFELAEVSNIIPILVGSGSLRNNTNQSTSLEVVVSITRTVSTSQTWSVSNTFSSSLSVGFSVGIPEVASVNGNITVGHERTISTEMGKTNEEAVQFQNTFKIDNVPPGVEVMVTVECTTGRCRIPFTYTSRDTRIDGVDQPPVDNVDGIFEGVSAFNIRGVASEVDRSTPPQILPVSVERIPINHAGE